MSACGTLFGTRYEADLAAHKRATKARTEKARAVRDEQAAVWAFRMGWEDTTRRSEHAKQAVARRLFNDQTRCKRAEAEELRQAALYNQSAITLRAEEAKARRAAHDAAAIQEQLNASKEKQYKLQLLEASSAASLLSASSIGGAGEVPRQARAASVSSNASTKPRRMRGRWSSRRAESSRRAARA